MKRLIFLIIAFILLIGFWYYNRTWRTFYQLETTFYAMGGIPVEVKGYHISRSRFEKAATRVRERFEELEQQMSTYRAASDISRVNREAALNPVVVPEETFLVLQAAVRISAETGGMFDITARPLIQLWKRAGKENRLPEPGEIERVMAHVGSDKLILDPAKRSVAFAVPGMEVDLGGLAKGYMCDEGIRILREEGIPRGMVNAAGDLVLYDDRHKTEPFHIGVRSPDSPANVMDRIEVDQGAVMTSGDYERYVTIEGKQYSHILNPTTGYPAEKCRSVTVLGPNGMDADAYATAAAILVSEGRPTKGFIPETYTVMDPVVAGIAQ